MPGVIGLGGCWRITKGGAGAVKKFGSFKNQLTKIIVNLLYLC